MNEDNIIKQLFKADGGPYSLSTAMSARSGSGKTTLLSTLISNASRSKGFENQRFIYLSLKQENPFEDKTPVVSSVDEMLKALRKNRIVVFYPPYPEEYESDVDDVIESVFDLAGNNPEAGFHLTIDDANILRGFSNQGNPSGSVKKLAIAGRSKGIRALFITHRLGNLPRLMNGNLSGLVLMSMNGSDSDYARKVFGLDFTDLIAELGNFRWAVVDLVKEKTHRFEPVSV